MGTFPLRLPKTLEVTECFARDGLQSLDRVLSTEEKLHFLKRLLACGFPRLEVTSMVPPHYLPQFYDGEIVLERMMGLCEEAGRFPLLIVFVPNEKGALRLLPFAEALGERLAFLTVVSASESHNHKNLKRTQEETRREHERIARVAHRYHARLIGSISVAFGCPYEGEIPFSRVLSLVQHYEDLGFHEVQFGDTIGVANPLQVAEFYGSLFQAKPGLRAVAHFHDNRGAALMNSLIAISAGAEVVDTSLGGLGGRPPDQRLQESGPTGNTSSEDLIVQLEAMGVETGVSVRELLDCGRELARHLEVPLYSHSLYSFPQAFEGEKGLVYPRSTFLPARTLA